MVTLSEVSQGKSLEDVKMLVGSGLIWGYRRCQNIEGHGVVARRAHQENTAERSRRLDRHF